MLIVSFPQIAPAQNLCAYLNSQNIKVLYKFDAELNQHQIVLQEPEKQEQAIAITKDFVRNPNEERFVASAWDNNIDPAQLNFGTGSDVKSAVINLAQTPVVATGILLCLVLYFSVYGLGQVSVYEILFFQPFAELNTSMQWWRLITPALMHFSAMHLVFNLLWWWWLGKQIEKLFGGAALFVFFLVVAFSTNISQYLADDWRFGGLSGVVYGLLGFVWWIQWLKPETGLRVPTPIVGFMLIWMVLGFADALWVDMANTAHAVGLVSGCLIAALTSKVMK